MGWSEGQLGTVGPDPDMCSEAGPMDQWNEASWLNRANLPTLRAVSGRSLRVLPRPDDLDYAPPPAPEIEPDGIRVLVVGDDVLARRGVLAALAHQPGLTLAGDARPAPRACAA